jgi:acetyl esterase
MNKIIEKIDPELWKAIQSSPFNEIEYEDLLINHPEKIREEEARLSIGENIETPKQLHIENIEITSSEKNRTIRLRTCRPKGKKNLSILIYFHGGAFIYGTPEQYDFIFYKLALDAELLIVSVDYRLAPEYPFPAAMEDGYDTLLWLSEHAQQLEGDKNKMIIGGSSAGATIAASITHLARDKKEVKINHQYLLYPPMSHLLQTTSMQELANAPMQTKEAAKWMWTHYLNNQLSNPPQYAVPLLEDNFQNLPPATIITCELDPLKDEAVIYADLLKEVGIMVNLYEIKGAVHAFDFFECPLSENFYHQQVKIFNQIKHQLK